MQEKSVFGETGSYLLQVKDCPSALTNK